MKLYYAQKAKWPRTGATLNYVGANLRVHCVTWNWPPEILAATIFSARRGVAGFELHLNQHEASVLRNALNSAYDDAKGPPTCPTPSSPATPDVPSHAKFEPEPAASKPEPTSKRRSTISSKRSTRP